MKRSSAAFFQPKTDHSKTCQNATELVKTVKKLANKHSSAADNRKLIHKLHDLREQAKCSDMKQLPRSLSQYQLTKAIKFFSNIPTKKPKQQQHCKIITSILKKAVYTKQKHMEPESLQPMT